MHWFVYFHKNTTVLESKRGMHVLRYEGKRPLFLNPGLYITFMEFIIVELTF